MPDLPYTVTKQQLCPHCGAPFDIATHATGGTAKPKEGDVSLCLSCGEPGIFTADLGVRAMTPQELDNVPPEGKRIIARSRAYARERGPLPDELSGHA